MAVTKPKGEMAPSMHGFSQLALLVLALGCSAQTSEVEELEVNRLPETDSRKGMMTFLKVT